MHSGVQRIIGPKWIPIQMGLIPGVISFELDGTLGITANDVDEVNELLVTCYNISKPNKICSKILEYIEQVYNFFALYSAFTLIGMGHLQNTNQ